MPSVRPDSVCQALVGRNALLVNRSARLTSQWLRTGPCTQRQRNLAGPRTTTPQQTAVGFFCAALHFLTSRGLGTPHAFRWAGFDMGSNKLPLIPNSLAHLSWSNRRSQLWPAGTRAEVRHFKLVGSTFGKQYGANVGAKTNAMLGCLLLYFAARLLRSVRSPS